MKKLCYVIPEYNPASPTHFAYLADFTEELRQYFNLRIIAERRFRLVLPLRLLFARFAGYRDFYVHYSFYATFLASLITKLLGGRVFYWNCGLPWKYKRPFWREEFERLIYKAISCLVTGTEGMKKMYAEHYHLPPEKIKVMPNWINLAKIKRQKSKGKSSEKVVLFVHRLSRRKGAHYLPTILAGLPQDAVMVIVGDGPERGSVQSQIRDLRLEDRVRFVGWKPQSEVADYFAAADVFIMPSEEEGFPHVILEAMAVGVPFVAFDVGGVREVTPPALKGYILSDGDLQGFIKRTTELLNSSTEETGRIIELEREWVKQYDIVEVARIFYENIVRD